MRSLEGEPFSFEIYHSLPSGLPKFLYLPSIVRDGLIQEAMIRAKEDADYFLSDGKTIDDFTPGTVLPSGNTVVQDEKGRNYVKAPIPSYLNPKDKSG